MSEYRVVCKTRYGEAFVFLYPECEHEFYGRHVLLNPVASTKLYPGCVVAFNPFSGYQRHPLVTKICHTDSSFVTFGPGVKGTSFFFNVDTFVQDILSVFDPLNEGACDEQYLYQIKSIISRMPDVVDLYKYLQSFELKDVAPFLRGFIKELFMSINSKEMSDDFQNFRALFVESPTAPPTVALQPKDIQSILMKAAELYDASFSEFLQIQLLKFCRCFVPVGVPVPSVIYRIDDGKYKEVSL